MKKETCGIFIHQIHNVIEKRMNNQLRKQGLTFSQINVLATLASTSEKKLSFKELEKQLALAQSTTAGLISRLEQKRMVSIYGDKDDKRIKYVEITDLGMKCCENAEQDMEETEKELVSCLSEAERKAFFSLLKDVKDTVTKF